MERKLVITGKGKLAVKPDIVILSFNVSDHQWEYDNALNNLNQKVENLRLLLDHNNIDRKDLKTRDFGISRDTVYDDKKKKNNFNGYVARHKLNLELPLDNQIINSLLLQIAKQFEDLDFSITFSAKDKKKYEKELVQNAINNAKELAKLITESAGTTLKEIIRIDYSFSELKIESERYDYTVMYEARTLATPDFEPESIKLKENITITWAIA